ncbi:hypothetical protein [Methanopyrus sp.]
MIFNKPVLERPSVTVELRSSASEWEAYLLSFHLAGSGKVLDRIVSLLKHLGELSLVLLDRADRFVDDLYRKLNRHWLKGELRLEPTKLEKCGDLRDVASARHGALGVGRVSIGLVGCEAAGGLPDHEAVPVRLRTRPVGGSPPGTAPRGAGDRLNADPEEAVVKALRLVAFRDVLYEIVTVAGRSASGGSIDAFLAVLGAGSLVKIATEHPEGVLEVYGEVRETLGGWAPWLKVYDPMNGDEHDLIELLEHGEVEWLPEPAFFKKVDRRVLSRLARWLERKLGGDEKRSQRTRMLP